MHLDTERPFHLNSSYKGANLFHLQIKPGKIVNIGSALGIIRDVAPRCENTPELNRDRPRPAYATVEGGVLALTQWIAMLVAGDSIYVNAVALGVCEFEMTKGYNYILSGIHMGRMDQP